MVTVTVQLFAAYREVVGTRELTLQVPQGATVADVWETLRAQYPRLRTPHPAAAVDQEYAELETPVHEGAEIAFLPPVSGGN